MEILRDIPCEINEEGLLKKIHRVEKETIKENLRKLISAFKVSIFPKIAYKVSYIQHKNYDQVNIEGETFKSRVLRKNLDKVERVFPYIITCGKEFEEMVDKCDRVIDIYYLDTIANTALSILQKDFSRYLKEKYFLGKVSRMNPGSLEDWPLSEQEKLFNLLGRKALKRELGVRLNESHVIIPPKSVSGIIFPTEKTFKSCQLCRREDCPERRAPFDESLLKSYYR